MTSLQPLSPETIRRLSELSVKLQIPEASRKMREVFMTCDQRAQLGQYTRRTGGLVAAWMDFHDLSHPRAIVELARHCNLFIPGEYEKLLESIGESQPRGKRHLRPKFEADGRLTLDGEVIRVVKRFKKPSTVERLLQAFEAARWRRTIPNPFESNVDPQATYDAIGMANKNLRRIRFEVQQGGQSIAWTNI